MVLVLIGCWRNETHPEWPDPADLVDLAWDEDERHSAGLYLASGTTARTWMGRSTCRLCGQPNGAADFADGSFIWPEGLAHYVSEHAVRLPRRIVDHAVRRLQEIEDQPVDDEWWSGLARP